jgi:hypothetical protein
MARVQGVYYFDATTGESKLLAAPSDSAVAELHPPNQVIYRSAFNSDLLQADLRYTYTKAGFESDVIITRQPKLSPQDCGFNPATTLLQVRHQWQNASAPVSLRPITVGEGTGPGMPDQFIDLGEMFFPPGGAFVTDGASSTDSNVPAQLSPASPQSAGASVPVGKEWQTGGGPGGSSLLIESVSWQTIATNLAQLPLMAEGEDSPWTGFLAGAATGGIHLAGGPSQTPGVLLDYTLVHGDYTDYTFQSYSPGSGPTYFVNSTNGSAYFSGTVTFQSNCVMKFCGGTCLALYGSVVCNGSQASPSVLTSEYDSQYGDIISTALLPTNGDVGTGLYFDYALQGNLTLNGLVIRYANTAIECDESCACNGGPCLGTTVANCAFYKCNTGVYTSGMNVTIQNSAVNSVATPLNWAGGCLYTFSGSFGQASPPVFSVTPSGQVVEQGNSVTFTAAVSPAIGAIYQWYGKNGSYGPVWAPIAGATGSSLTVANVVDGTRVEVYGESPFGTVGWSAPVSAAVLGSDAWTAWTTLLNNTNGKTPNVWATMTLTQPPALAWNTSSLIYGKTGYTAISQLNSWDINNPPNGPGVVPVTALTARHGYTRGHGMGGTATNYWLGPPYPPLMTVWFCLPPTNVVQVNVLAYIVRDEGTNGGDYTVLLFDSDLPAGMTMQVSSPPQGGTVQLATQQHAYGTNVPGTVALWKPAPVNGPPMTLPFLPVYGDYGDSGSPVMVLTGSGALVFLHGTTTTGPGSPGNSPMQADMDTLSTWAGLSPASYKMQWSQQ